MSANRLRCFPNILCVEKEFSETLSYIDYKSLIRFICFQVMNIFNMPCYVAWSSKLFFADLTFERFWSGMDAHMISQATRLCELFFAYFTFEWLCSSMSSHMHRQATGLCEFFFAQFTFESFFSSMSSHMRRQIVRSCKFFFAYLDLKSM